MVEPIISLLASCTSVSAHHDQVAAKLLGLVRDDLRRPTDGNVQRDRLHRQPEWLDDPLDHAPQFLAAFLGEYLFVIRHRRGGGEQLVLDEKDNEPRVVFGRDESGVGQRLTGVDGKVNRAENCAEQRRCASHTAYSDRASNRPAI